MRLPVLCGAADLAALDMIISAIKDAILHNAHVFGLTGDATDPISRTASAEATKEAKPLITEISERKQGRGFVMGVVAKVTDLLQLSVSDVHVRLECHFKDASGKHTRDPFSLGVVLGSVGISSVDSEGKSVASRADSSLSFIRKHAHIEGFGVYVDHGDEFRVSVATGTISNDMKALISPPRRLQSRLLDRNPSVPTLQSSLQCRRYVLAPMHVNCSVLINDSGYPPKMELVRLVRYVESLV